MADRAVQVKKTEKKSRWEYIKGLLKSNPLGEYLTKSAEEVKQQGGYGKEKK